MLFEKVSTGVQDIYILQDDYMRLSSLREGSDDCADDFNAVAVKKTDPLFRQMLHFLTNVLMQDCVDLAS
jgi:hypothetical protein